MPANATPKSTTPTRRYTPSAYHPYDVMRYLSFCEKDAFGGRAEDEGDGERDDVRRAGMWWNRRLLERAPCRAPCRVSEMAESDTEYRVKGRMGVDTRGTRARRIGIRKMRLRTIGTSLVCCTSCGTASTSVGRRWRALRTSYSTTSTSASI